MGVHGGGVDASDIIGAASAHSVLLLCRGVVVVMCDTVLVVDARIRVIVGVVGVGDGCLSLSLIHI